MDTKCLEEICIGRFGENKGKKLFEVMKRISLLDVCVATGWYADQISIARKCENRGSIFHLTKSYKSIRFNDRKAVKINYISKEDLDRYLPSDNSRYFEHFLHCQFDKVFH